MVLLVVDTNRRERNAFPPVLSKICAVQRL